jgi:CheY-like chemotaxis protein
MRLNLPARKDVLSNPTTVIKSDSCRPQIPAGLPSCGSLSKDRNRVWNDYFRRVHARKTFVTGESVLIVEEDGIIAFHLREILKRAGYRGEDPVTSCENALDRLSCDPLPGVLVIDAGVSERSGNFSELFRTCSIYQVPIVILTTFSDRRDAGGVPGTSRTEFITMPFSERELLVTIEKVLQVAR